MPPQRMYSGPHVKYTSVTGRLEATLEALLRQSDKAQYSAVKQAQLYEA